MEPPEALRIASPHPVPRRTRYRDPHPSDPALRRTPTDRLDPEDSKRLCRCAAPHVAARARAANPTPEACWEQAKESTRNIEELKARDGPACLIPTIARDMHDAVSMNHESKGPPGKCGTSNPVRELSRLSMEQPCCHHACSHLTLMSNRNSMLHACIWNGVGSCNSHSCYGPG